MKLTKYYKNQLFYAFLVKYNVQASADKVLAMWGLVRVCAKFHLQKEYALTKLLAVKSSYFFKAFLLRVILESGHSSMLIRWKVMRKTLVFTNVFALLVGAKIAVQVSTDLSYLKAI